jgi:hypothetical protein
MIKYKYLTEEKIANLRKAEHNKILIELEVSVKDYHSDLKNKSYW